ncbi:hypothetical protein CNMCM5623_006831 [Aspergillus felis]|uniref:Uncharacterized protein n=1 Tax=Aspergillus felis TaxID=1287682 RepID=A0A8H6VE23_9EURO|nr:hypothetical protein CNMCM5623_006831 [Aspergillus felis]KAF7184754.1 hypothetical protein CNMCM7691_006247 [Aspergillus felis]
MPTYKRLGSPSLQSLRRSRRIANIPGNKDVAVQAGDENSSENDFDEDRTRDTDGEYELGEDDEEAEHDDDNEKEEEEEDKIRTLKKDVKDKASERVVTIIPYEKLRPLDGVEYADYKVHRNTLLYLKDLKANNRRAWFKDHQKEFRRALKDWESFIETLMPKIIAFDSTIPELPPNDVIFRVYRDLRFSKDQRPYKSHFSAAFSRTGRRRPYACYYIHLEPGSSYVGGGLWAPEPPTIQLLRESIDERPHVWRQLLSSEAFRGMFLPNAKGGVEGALTAFADVNKEGALKTKPKYEAPWFSLQVEATINRRLLQYWLERVSQMLVIDPDDNPYSFPALEYITKSSALVHIIQSISAQHEQYFPTQAPVIALEERGKALASFRKELEHVETTPRASLLTAMLLTLSHAADPDMTDFGKEHLFAARILVNRMLQDTSALSEPDCLPRLCFGMYLYADMCSAFLVDPDEQQQSNSLEFAIAVQRMGLWHHPMYGSCTELLFILANVGRYCRQVIHSPRRNPSREAILEQQLYKWSACSARPALDLIYEALRKHGLIFLYRITGWNDSFTNPALKESSLEAVIHHYAIKTVQGLLEIPITSNYLNFQSLPLLTAGSELGESESGLRDQVRQRFRAIYSLNRLPANLHALQLLEELWAAHDSGKSCFWVRYMLQKGWRLLLG